MQMNARIERAIITLLVNELKVAGYVPAYVWDGGEYVTATDERAVRDAVFAVDESTIHFAPKDAPEKWGRLGVFCVCGNGEDIVSDYHCGDEAFAAAVKAACDKAESMTLTFA